jgi:hypothetical protein
MEPMDAAYTATSMEEANRVAKYLEVRTDTRLQGSVTTNTHIRYHSDLDILTINREFVTHETTDPSQSYLPPGFDPIAALRLQRINSRDAIRSNFPAVSIDETRSRALTLTGGTLKRKVDVVTTNWYDTDDYKRHNAEVLRGVQLLDISLNTRVVNKPFIHQALINHKGNETNDGAKRAMRLLKTLRVDAASKIDISSYDICSIVWHMQNGQLPAGDGFSLINARNVEDFLWKICENNGAIGRTLRVPNGTRNIVDAAEGTSIGAIHDLWLELYRLLKAIRESGKAVDRQYILENNSMRLSA